MGRKEELSSNQIDAKLKEFEQKLERLHRTYEQHFIGIEKRPPHAQRRQVFRLLQELDKIYMSSTAQKFRLRAARQRFNSYKSYWNRVQKQIEEGTYHRDKKRARRRQKARERREQAMSDAEDGAQEQSGEEKRTSGQAEDGTFDMDLDEFEDLDLNAMEQELQEMEKKGEFEKYVGTEKMRRKEFPEDSRTERTQQPAAQRGDQQGDQQQREQRTGGGARQDKLREIQRKLGLSGGGGQGSEGGSDNQFDRESEGPTRKSRGENPLAPDRGADMSKIQRLRKAKERIEREREERKKKQARHKRRVIRRSGGGARAGESQEDKARRVYNNLLEAKRRCNEDTSGLSYDSVKKSMDKQASRLRETKGASNVDFKVVIKDGRAFLKPETK